MNGALCFVCDALIIVLVVWCLVQDTWCMMLWVWYYDMMLGTGRLVGMWRLMHKAWCGTLCAPCLVCTMLGAQYMVQDTWCKMLGGRYLVHNIWFVMLGLQCFVWDVWCMMLCSWVVGAQRDPIPGWSTLTGAPFLGFRHSAGSTLGASPFLGGWLGCYTYSISVLCCVPFTLCFVCPILCILRYKSYSFASCIVYTVLCA